EGYLPRRNTFPVEPERIEAYMSLGRRPGGAARPHAKDAFARAPHRPRSAARIRPLRLTRPPPYLPLPRRERAPGRPRHFCWVNLLPMPPVEVVQNITTLLPLRRNAFPHPIGCLHRARYPRLVRGGAAET